MTSRLLAHLTGDTLRRIQFTPDLMPSDITGINVYNTVTGQFTFQPGPLFAEILLGDEINRAPAKTQSALLEAMQERQVTVDGVSHSLGSIFTVFATQNPIEFEGTYALPAAQVDRFMMKILVDYPDEDNEARILDQHESGLNVERYLGTATPMLTRDTLSELRNAVNTIHSEEDVRRYITRLVTGTRKLPQVLLGASPRTAVQWLQAAKAHAVIEGRSFITPDDVKGIARPMLRHRLILKPEVEVEGVTPDDCVNRLLNEVSSPE